MKRVAFVLLLALSLQSSWPSSLSAAVQPDEILTNPPLETRARALSQQLRCMVCQNESIDESDAPLARDLRVLVLLKPRLSWRTAALWGLPPGLLLTGIALLVIGARRRRGRAQEPEVAKLTAAEETQLRRILAEGGGS